MNTARKRCWYQFSLRTLLFGVTIFCVGPIAWVANERNRTNVQRASMDVISHQGGQLEWDVLAPERSPLLKWLLGDNIGDRIATYSFAQPKRVFSDKDIKYVLPFTRLKTLKLPKSHVTDAGLAQIASLSSLEELRLNGTGVGDAGLVHLAKMKSLKLLDLDGTRATDDGVKKLQESLPQVKVIR